MYIYLVPLHHMYPTTAVSDHRHGKKAFQDSVMLAVSADCEEARPTA